MKSINCLIITALILSCHAINANPKKPDSHLLAKAWKTSQEKVTIEFEKNIKKNNAQCMKEPNKRGCEDYTEQFCKTLPKDKDFIKFKKTINQQKDCKGTFKQVVKKLEGNTKAHFDLCKIKAGDVCH